MLMLVVVGPIPDLLAQGLQLLKLVGERGGLRANGIAEASELARLCCGLPVLGAFLHELQARTLQALVQFLEPGKRLLHAAQLVRLHSKHRVNLGCGHRSNAPLLKVSQNSSEGAPPVHQK